MRLLISLVSLIAIGIFIWQNRQPIVLVLFNQTLPLQLPLAVWLVLFLFLGIVTSLILQFLYRFPRPRKRRPVKFEAEFDQAEFDQFPTTPPTTFTATEPLTEPTAQNKQSLRAKMNEQKSLYSSDFTSSSEQNREVSSKKSPTDEQEDIYEANFKVVETDSSTQPKQDDEEENWI